MCVGVQHLTGGHRVRPCAPKRHRLWSRGISNNNEEGALRGVASGEERVVDEDQDSV
ncbi:hypothetical protein RHMOL_Rhmol13G0220600 [Rhododendron molle]|uniref:Uncharacterized protein n=1 Tax=Rhododendron molle TaxID=49168 RepID=A0ACC0L9B1_RHOML|nr:hypothetical protein RHMOL_Rhmol13G0220600 [Rhododendron molle]